jgi:signal transduction histidine kinase
LRTPLTAITGQIEVALMNQRSIEEYETIFNSVLEDIKSLTHLINGLLMLAQTNTETIIANFTSLRIDEILLQAREALLKKYEEIDIIIVFENLPDDEKELMVSGNEQLLKSALMNLLDNACKFSQGQPVKAIVGFHRRMVLIKIQDQGIGISSEDLTRIFEPFFRGQNAFAFKGYGLGLSLTRRILDMHGALLKVHSATGKGTLTLISLNKI